jgi:hypothetical protein
MEMILQISCGISMGVAKKPIRNWKISDHRKHLDSLSGLKKPGALCYENNGDVKLEQRPFMKGGRTTRRTLPPKSHLFKLGLVNNSRCERCLEEESATHILYDYEAIAYLRFRHVGYYFKEPNDYHDAPVRKVLRFIRSVGFTKG